MAEKYVLRVTAGPTYDPSTHVVIPVNTSTATPIESPHCTANLKVRVQKFRGQPLAHSPVIPLNSYHRLTVLLQVFPAIHLQLHPISPSILILMICTRSRSPLYLIRPYQVRTSYSAMTLTVLSATACRLASRPHSRLSNGRSIPALMEM